MTSEKMIATATNKKEIHKRMYNDYVRSVGVPKLYNRGEVNGDIFILTRIKDNHVICRFNIKTFEAL